MRKYLLGNADFKISIFMLKLVTYWLIKFNYNNYNFYGIFNIIIVTLKSMKNCLQIYLIAIINYEWK